MVKRKFNDNVVELQKEFVPEVGFTIYRGSNADSDTENPNSEAVKKSNDVRKMDLFGGE